MSKKYNSSVSEDKNKSEKMVPISSLPISTRLRNRLRRSGVEYLQQVENYTEENILKMRNIGRSSLQELKNVCEQYGVHIYCSDDMNDSEMDLYLTPAYYDILFKNGIRTKEDLVNTDKDKLADIFGTNSAIYKRLLNVIEDSKNSSGTRR